MPDWRLTVDHVDVMTRYLKKLFKHQRGARPSPLLVTHAPERRTLDRMPELQQRLDLLRDDPRQPLAAFPRTKRGWKSFAASSAFARLNIPRQPAFPVDPGQYPAVMDACPAGLLAICLFDGLAEAQKAADAASELPTMPPTFAEAKAPVHAALIAMRDNKENSETFPPTHKGYMMFRETPEGQRLCLPAHPSMAWKGSRGWPGLGGYVALMSVPPQV